jgi:hypothetical protein
VDRRSVLSTGSPSELGSTTPTPYDEPVERHGGVFGWLPPALRTLERKLGADREGRTLWVWIVPGFTLVVTFAVLAFIGIQGQVDLGLTLPMAFVLSIFLGSLSAFYLTAASSDERDKDDGPDERRGPGPGPGPGPELPPPPDTQVTPAILRVPGRPPRAAEQPAPQEAEAPSRR